ncbi:hypothetical protein WR25_21201 [Diploscapter pachys]|uniref:Cux N-terminal domain-containing protein n=1 Tax=Diploscapter pachys TaxID=2018661 RepID=A0A2A2KXL3_9BILA|nr:hypothetical protein WR25_21201 [Diploscapter pachys]
MLKRSELEDPRKTIPEGKKLTACWVDIMKNLQLKCAKEVDKAVQCVEHNNCRQETLPCFKEMSAMDECAKTKLGLIRPAPGYFSTPMVYYGDRPKPQPVFRDYQKEAKDVIEEMPEEYHLKKDYKMWKARIDEEIHAIEVRVEGSEAGKKLLLDESTKYREKTNKETRQVAVPLIKTFQREVDGLNARSQVAETALIEICSQLTNLPA